MLKKFLSTLGVLLLVAIAAIGVRTFINRHNNKQLVPSAIPTSKVNNKTSQGPTFDKTKFSTTDPASVWVVVNKHHALTPADYTPGDLIMPNVPLRVPGNESMQVRHVTAAALETMFADAKTEGVNLMLSSGYRSYQYQVNLYGGYVKNGSAAEADKTSARPGFSEHQTGLAADIEPMDQKCDVDVCFATTPEGIWLAANAYKYGFIIRYTADKVTTTGYSYEPWHIRYVGNDLVNEMRKEKVETLEEFFNLGAAPDYSS